MRRSPTSASGSREPACRMQRPAHPGPMAPTSRGSRASSPVGASASTGEQPRPGSIHSRNTTSRSPASTSISFTPGQKRFGVEEIAHCFAALMTDVLGYRRVPAQGGDWGGFVTSVLGHAYPEHLIGIHLNLLPLRRDPAMVANPSAEERAYLDALAR